jgi:TrmH family RNA methyltransferase
MITSTTNPTIKRVRSLGANNLQARRAEGAFVVEGVRAVEEALDGGAQPTLVLYDPEALGGTVRGAALQERLVGLRVAQPASASALAAATDTVQPQGVVAVFPMPTWPAPHSATHQGNPAGFRTPPLALVLDSLRDPGNLGTILRGAEAAGVTGCWLTPDCVDLYNPKVVRAGAGVHFRLPCYGDQPWPAIKATLTGLGIGTVAALDAAGEMPYYRADWRQPAALIVGNEAHGLSAAAEAAATLRVAIPMRGGTESLNAAMAASVVLFEALRQRSV